MAHSSGTLGRIIAIGLLLGALAAGWFLSGRAERASRDRIAHMQEVVGDVEEGDVGVMAKVATYDPGRYIEIVKADAEKYGLPEPQITELANPQKHVVELDEPVVLRAGETWKGKKMSIRASVEKVNYQQHGATVSAPHRVVTLTNNNKAAVAYKLAVGAPGTEKCKVRGSRMHNAMTLRPKETAEIVVCAGQGRVRVEMLETLEITELGYHYFAQLPPTAVGYDSVSAHAHRPLVKVSPCDRTDPTAILRMLGTGSSNWVDVADFFSRHSCHEYDLFEAYRHSEEPLTRLPAAPPDLPQAP